MWSVISDRHGVDRGHAGVNLPNSGLRQMPGPLYENQQIVYEHINAVHL